MKMDDAMKKAVISASAGALCILLSFVTLSGSTYALFYDHEANQKNLARAAIMNAKLLKYDPQAQEYVELKEDEDLFDSSLVNPAEDTVAYLAIENAGDIDLDYEIVMNVRCPGQEDEVRAADIVDYIVIEDIQAQDELPEDLGFENVGQAMGQERTATIRGVYNVQDCAPGNIKYLAIVFAVKEEPGIEYMDKALSVDLHLLASQTSK